MSEIPAPLEVINEAAKPDSPESPKQEAGKNYDIQKLFEDFRSSPEYQKGFEERSIKIQPKMAFGNFSDDEQQQLLVAGYEGARVIVGGKEYDFEAGEHNKYKGAFMHYVERYWDETHLWPLYFSPEHQNEEVTSVYEDYKEKARVVWEHVNKGTNLLEQRGIDKTRSDAHDRLAGLLYKEGGVKTLLDGKLVARMWLVSDGVESPAGITFMDQARIMREFHHSKNIENEKK